MDLGPQELLIILVVVLVLFGGAKLPQLARSLGQAKKEFQDGMADGKKPAVTEAAAEPVPAPAPAPLPPANPTSSASPD